MRSEEMKIAVRQSTMVIPAKDTPMTKLWLSNLDLAAPLLHTPIMFYYRHNGSTNFFDARVMKDALSRVLVPFYPFAGRLKDDNNGRIEIDCQGQGALFVEAECDALFDDLDDFTPMPCDQMLFPFVDYSLEIESYPPLVVQVTYFKCGGVSLAVGAHHYVVDGKSLEHFFLTWCDLARGLNLTVQPIIDRSLLRARDPPQPIFDHLEFKITPMMSSVVASSNEPLCSVFKFSREQLNMLKTKSKEDGNTIDYTTFEVLLGHIWKCVCIARGLPNDQETKLYIATDGRLRGFPALPPGYFGNGIMFAAPVALAGEIQSNSRSFSASKIHNALVMRNNEYLNSTLDYVELHSDPMAHSLELFQSIKCSNLLITSWVTFLCQDVDFGWGQPIYVGPGWVPVEGVIFVLPTMINDGSLSISITLQEQHLKLFSQLLYEFFHTSTSLPSKL